MMKKIKKYLHLKYDLIIVPRDISSTKSSIRFKISTFILLLIGLLTVSNLFLIILFSYTPLGKILPLTGYLTSEDYQQLNSLKEKVVILSNEVERVSKINERLKLILEGKPIPVDPRDLDTNYQIKKKQEDSLRILQKFRLTNNLMFVGRSIFKKHFDLFEHQNSDTIKGNREFLFFIKPVEGIVTRAFDRQLSHLGADFAVPIGTPVRASASGIVVFADFTINDGYKIILSHDRGYITVYKHLSQIFMKERDIVKQGDVIGLSGNTGRLTTGPHLHFEVWKYQTPIDPKLILVDYNER